MADSGKNNSIVIINKNLDNKNNCANMEWFYDIFDILNDDDDDEPEEELENIIEEYYQDFDFDNIDTNVDDEEMMFENDSLTKHDHEDKIVEEQILSQKLSQLSTKNDENDGGDDDDEKEYSSSKKKRSFNTSSTSDVTS